jgi:hypothetical protein
MILYNLFAKYFKNNYANSNGHFALKQILINMNMYVEAFRRVLKHVYFNKRIDKLIGKLFKLQDSKLI